MTSTQPLQDDIFTLAWNDLRDRLNSGIDTLSVLQRDAETRSEDPALDPAYRRECETNALRLNFKRTGVEEALAAWDRLDETVRATDSEAAAWRTFTDEVFSLWQSAPDASVTEGLAVALSYQRGYSPGVDAPPLVALASLPAGRSLRK